MGRGDSIWRSASASAVPSGSPIGKTRLRSGGSDSTRVTVGILRREVQRHVVHVHDPEGRGGRRRLLDRLGARGVGASVTVMPPPGAHAESQPDRHEEAQYRRARRS